MNEIKMWTNCNNYSHNLSHMCWIKLEYFKIIQKEKFSYKSLSVRAKNCMRIKVFISKCVCGEHLGEIKFEFLFSKCTYTVAVYMKHP